MCSFPPNRAAAEAAESSAGQQGFSKKIACFFSFQDVYLFPGSGPVMDSNVAKEMIHSCPISTYEAWINSRSPGLAGRALRGGGVTNDQQAGIYFKHLRVLFKELWADGSSHWLSAPCFNPESSWNVTDPLSRASLNPAAVKSEAGCKHDRLCRKIHSVANYKSSQSRIIWMFCEFKTDPSQLRNINLTSRF